MSMDPCTPIYRTDTPGARYVQIAGAISAVLVIATIGAVFYSWAGGWSQAPVLYVVVAIWAICPATWFWYEYFFLYRRFGAPDTFDLFKHGQQTAVAIWAGVSLSLVALAASDHFKEPKGLDCKCEAKR